MGFRVSALRFRLSGFRVKGQNFHRLRHGRTIGRTQTQERIFTLNPIPYSQPQRLAKTIIPNSSWTSKINEIMARSMYVNQAQKHFFQTRQHP